MIGDVPIRLRLSQDASLRHRNGDVKSILRAGHRSKVLSSDVESRTVSRSSYRDRKTTLDCNTAVEGKQLHCDLSLVVVHSNDAVKVLPFEEDGVTREWSNNVNAFLASCLDRRAYMINLLTAK